MTFIDYRMLPAKLSYFFTYAAFGSFIPYINVFLTSVGLTPSQAGLISGLRTIVSFICGPIWGALVDHTGRRKLIYVLLCLGTISLLFPLPWIAKHVTGDFQINSNGNHSNESSSNSTIFQNSFEDKSKKNLFLAMLAVFFASAVFDTPLRGHLDSIIMNVLSSNTQEATFGFQRVFASISFGTANFLAGLAADNYNHSSFSSYTAIFFVFLPAGLLMIPFGLILHNQETKEKVCRKSKTDNRIFKQVLDTCTRIPNVIFFIAVFSIGLANAINFGFTFFLMQDYMVVSKSIMGLAMACSALSEIFVFPVASRIITFLGGTIPCIIIGIFVWFIRFLSFSFVENPWLVLPILSLNCLSFALPWAAAIEQVNVISPKAIHTTMFSILTVIHYPLSILIGNMVGGVLYEKYGGRVFFRALSIIYASWGVLMVLYFYVFNIFCLKNKSGEKNGGDADSIKGLNEMHPADYEEAKV